MSAMGGKRTLQTGRRKGYSDNVRVVTALSLFGLLGVSAQQAVAIDQSRIPEENYDFLSVTAGPCMPKDGIEPKYEPECLRMTEPRRYRGTWHVEFEGSYFTPVGWRDRIETEAMDCAALVGKPPKPVVAPVFA